MTGLFSALAEAWQELRIHKTRVLLSLIGVAVAVCALTVVVGMGGIVSQANQETSDRGGGRAATLQISEMAPPAAGGPTIATEWPGLIDRYDVAYASRVTQGTATVQFVDGAVMVGVTAVYQPYATMHRVRLDGGTWFAPDDGLRLAPAIVVNPAFWQRIGSPDLATHPTVPIIGGQGATAVVIGVYQSPSWDTEPAMFMLQDSYDAVVPTDPTMPGYATYEMWVPAGDADALIQAMQGDLDAAFGAQVVTVNRSDWGAFQEGDPLLPLKLTITGIAVLVLLLGALGLVNIALVTVRYRIREIGIRRSFGATGGRVFFAVMLESVVGTVVAGIVGVGLAVVIVTSPWVVEMIGQGMVTDVPPFPLEAAVIGLAAATAVGALAGLLPALVAVRVKVIDAIRY